MTINDVETRLKGRIPRQQDHDQQRVRQSAHTNNRPAQSDWCGLRVLVVGINYRPEHTGIAPYTTQVCDYLESEGASVSVFTGVPHYPAWLVDPQFRWRVRRIERSGRLELRRLRHYVPKSQSAIRRAIYELTFALQVAVQHTTERPHVILAVVPSLLSAVAARRIAERAKVPIVVWVQDLMGRAAAQSGIDGGTRVARTVSAIERWVLRRASHVLVINTHSRQYVESLGINPDCVSVRPNWTHLSPPTNITRYETRSRLGWRPNELIVLHTGNMGLKQDLENVIHAARLAENTQNNNVRFVLMGDGSQRQALEQMASSLRAITVVPPAPTSEYAEILGAADILLVNERPTAVDMSLPSKLTSYFLAGRPVLAACSSDGATATEIRRSGAGIVVAPGEPSTLLEALLEIAAAPDHAALLGASGQDYAANCLDSDQALKSVAAVLAAAAMPNNKHAGQTSPSPRIQQPTTSLSEPSLTRQQAPNFNRPEGANLADAQKPPGQSGHRVRAIISFRASVRQVLALVTRPAPGLIAESMLPESHPTRSSTATSTTSPPARPKLEINPPRGFDLTSVQE